MAVMSLGGRFVSGNSIKQESNLTLVIMNALQSGINWAKQNPLSYSGLVLA